MATVEITNIEKYYGGYHALNDINVDIADGEFVVLVGRRAAESPRFCR